MFAAMCPLKSYLAAVVATCCVLSAVAEPAEPRPSMPREITELKNALAAFMKTHEPGTAFGNIIIQRIRELRATAAKEGLDPNEDVRPPAASDKQT